MQLTLPVSDRKPLLRWLILCLALVALMVVVGGLTRLTESGLSMVEWKPTTLLPPIGETQWQAEFAKYRQSPQYLKVNHDMELEGFQQIFWLEYIHRLLGRLVGFVFFAPFMYFLIKKALPAPLAWKLGGIFLLGGCQGLIGWYMVKSGLIDQPWVSPVRLMLHLGMAFLLFGLLWWQILNLSHWERLKSTQAISGEGESVESTPSPGSQARRPLPWGEVTVLALLYLQTLLGALVAGMDAGLLYNTFPDMNGTWLPEGIWLLEPWYRNLAENGTTVHFLHRLGALILACAILALSIRNRLWLLLAALILQIALGAATVIYAVPVLIATAHQAVALLLFALMLRQVFLSVTSR